MTRYRFGDLVLESELDLPSLPVSPAAPVDCKVRLRPAPGTRYSDSRWDHHWRDRNGSVCLSCAKTGAGYRLGVPGLALISVSEGGRGLTCSPEGAVPPTTLEHLLVDQVLPRVLAWRGRTVLHAGSVSSSEGAVAFVGESGSGKSTLCAAFARAGWTLLGDDAVVVRRAEDGGYETFAVYPGLRLLPPVMRRLLDGADASPVAHYTEKRRVPAASVSVDPGPRPLRAIFVLESSRAANGAVWSTSLRGREALLALVRSTFQLHLDDPVEGRAVFERVGELADRVPVRTLAFPRTFDVFPGVIAEVERTAFQLAVTR